MNESYKILIAYDGSSFADAALDDLRLAGLPVENVDALTVSVAEIWLPPQKEKGAEQEFVTEGLRRKYEENLTILNEAGETARRAAERLKQMFPLWNVASEATYGSPAWEVLTRARDFQPDLIVVGSQGLSAVERVLIGSVSQKIVTEAECSVRVGRGKIETDETLTRLVIGYDGTDGANEVVNVVASRRWSAGSEARVVMVEDSLIIQEDLGFERDIFEQVGATAVNKLREGGLKAELIFLQGNPKQEIVEEAEKFRADCIFVGATKLTSWIERLLIGSVSSAITARAFCSVEVVRPNYYKLKKR